MNEQTYNEMMQVIRDIQHALTVDLMDEVDHELTLNLIHEKRALQLLRARIETIRAETIKAEQAK